MATRLTRRNHHAVLIAAAALAATAAVIPTAANARPFAAPRATPPAPTTTSVQAKLDDLAKQNDQAVERYNQAQVQVQRSQRAASVATQRAGAAQRAFNQSMKTLSATISAQYESGAFSAAGALLTSDNGQDYLDALSTLSMVNSHNSQVVVSMEAAKKQAAAAASAASSALATAVAERKAAAAEKQAVAKQINNYTVLLATLTPVQHAAYVSSVAPAIAKPNIAIPAGAAGKAVQFALAQVGKPYVWATAGPNSYDCSGLTMAAWAAGGVSLPHSSLDQYSYGTHVPISALQPGDLVFMYSPIHHVTIYVGDGMLVSAVEPGVGVQLVTLASQMSIVVGATHL